jgi:hypothetical protein
LDSLAVVASAIPPHIPRGWVVGVVQDGEVIDLKRYRSFISSSAVLPVTHWRYPTADVVHGDIDAIMEWCADQSVEAYA